MIFYRKDKNIITKVNEFIGNSKFSGKTSERGDVADRRRVNFREASSPFYRTIGGRRFLGYQESDVESAYVGKLVNPGEIDVIVLQPVPPVRRVHPHPGGCVLYCDAIASQGEGEETQPAETDVPSVGHKVVDFCIERFIKVFFVTEKLNLEIESLVLDYPGGIRQPHVIGAVTEPAIDGSARNVEFLRNVRRIDVTQCHELGEEIQPFRSSAPGICVFSRHLFVFL